MMHFHLTECHFSPPLVCLRFYFQMNDSMQSLCGLNIAEITDVYFGVKTYLLGLN